MVGERRVLPTVALSASVVAAALCLPAVRRATGIPAAWTIGLIGSHVLWSIFVSYALTIPGRGFRTRTGINIAMVGNLLLNTGICVAFCALGGEPRTPLWMLPVLYTSINGAAPNFVPSVAILLVHVIAPLLTIPLFVGNGSGDWAIAAPILCAAICGVAYHTLAMWTAKWREVQQEQDDALSALRTKLDERDRARLALDLHDSVGSVLGVVGLYGDLIERHCDRPDELRSIASQVRDATKEGLTELRAVLDAMAPASTDVDGVARALRQMVRRVSAASDTEVALTVEGEGALTIDGPARLALVRVFGEALHNALRHAQPKTVNAVLLADVSDVTIDVSDDGHGFESSGTSGNGRGLKGMKERIEELGGRFVLESASGRGTRVRATVPRTRPCESHGTNSRRSFRPS